MIPFENEVADYVKKNKKNMFAIVLLLYLKITILLLKALLWKLCLLKIMEQVLNTMYLYTTTKKGVIIDYKTGKYTVK